MTSGGRSTSSGGAETDDPGRTLSGPVEICLDRPVLSLDRPFTYELGEDVGAGVGSLVQVRFHGKLSRGWVLGAAAEIPERMLPVRKALSQIRFFDRDLLALYRWMAVRYVAPLATVIGRGHPPRVASEEALDDANGYAPPSATGAPRPADGPLGGYRGGETLREALRRGQGTFLMRPAPEHEQAAAVEAVGEALAFGRAAIVLVPEAEPLPATARAVADAFGDTVLVFAGGDRRERYRQWLAASTGGYSCVVGTRPAVFAPLRRLGLIWLARESHQAHREERSPYYHVRDVALARARAAGAVCVMSALCPSAEAFVAGGREVRPARRSWPPVEVVAPGPEGRAPRLVSALRQSPRAFLYSPLPGYGVARVCRACGDPAACASCGGALRAEEGTVRCSVCEADGICVSCGARTFGVAKGGVERVAEWAAEVSPAPVRRAGIRGLLESGRPGVAVGGPEAVKELPPPSLDLVGLLDVDGAGRLPGLAAPERALAVWMEATGWARPKGRAIVQTRNPSSPVIQALVTGNPERFYRHELPRRAEAGFAAGDPVFRVAGTTALPEELRGLDPVTLLVSSLGGRTVCLVAVRPGEVEVLGRLLRRLATTGVVDRVEAEPHL
jgi:primosomal protein N' (replication factor Y)